MSTFVNEIIIPIYVVCIYTAGFSGRLIIFSLAIVMRSRSQTITLLKKQLVLVSEYKILCICSYVISLIALKFIKA